MTGGSRLQFLLYSECHLWHNGCFSHTFSALLVTSPSPTGLRGFRFPNASFMVSAQVSLTSDDRVTLFPLHTTLVCFDLLLWGFEHQEWLRATSWFLEIKKRWTYRHCIGSLSWGQNFSCKSFIYNTASLWQAGKLHHCQKIHTTRDSDLCGIGGSNTFIKYKRLFCSAVTIIQNNWKINRIAVLW